MSQILDDGHNDVTATQIDLYALNGNDRVTGGVPDDGSDWYGGGGSDALLFQPVSGGFCDLYGGGGNDTLHGGASAAEFLHGEDGNDLIASGKFVWSTAASNGTIVLDAAGSGGDFMDGGMGADAIYGFDGDDFLWGGSGSDAGIITVAHALTVNATMGNIAAGLYGGAGRDYLDGNVGDDYLDGGTDADTIYGGDGFDSIYGGQGVDGIDAGKDNDTVYGGSDGDAIMGGDGGDTLRGEAGADTILGGNIGDVILGGTETDNLAGEAGNDTIYGDDGTATAGHADNISGGDGNDQLYGNGGGDTIYGGDGNDALEGQVGADILRPQAGYDYMTGGADGDTFLFDTTGFRQDTIWDFTHLVDRISFHRNVFANFAAVQAATTQNGAHTYINKGNGDLIVLANFTAGHLTAADFTFF